MTTATRLTWLSALAVLLASSSLWRVFDDPGLGWLAPVIGAVVVVALAGLLSRRLRLPVLLQPVVGALAVGLYAAVVYAQHTFAAGLIPTTETLRLLGTRIGEGLLDIEELAPPVPTTPGLVLLTLLGAGAIAVAVDLASVGLRRPALSGLPLLALLIVPAATIDGGVGAVPFGLGAVGWLALLMADNGERVGRWGTALRSGAAARTAPRSDASLGRVGRRIGVAALGAALVVPALLPGLDSSLVTGGGGSGLGSGSRSATTYNPITELAGQLRLPEPRNLLRYTTSDPSPDYLRLTTLDVFDDDSGWSSSGLSADVREDGVDEGIPTPVGASSADVQPLTTVIDIQGLGGSYLPVPPVPEEVEVDGNWLWEEVSQTVFSARTTVEEIDGTYRVEAQRVVPSPQRLSRGGVFPDELDELAVPPEVSPYVREETARVTAGAATPYEQALALQAYFREGNGFRYSEDTSVPGIDAPNRLEEFLRGKRGFCEQYASAMGAMARLLGLPTRVAVGFTPGTRQDDGTFQVTTNDAHAWPEIWFAGHGWVRFEPTPRDEQVTTPDYTTAPAPGAEPEAAAPETPTGGEAPAPGADDAATAAEQERLLRDEALNAPGAAVETGTPWGRRVGAALLVLAVLAVPALVAALRRRRRWDSPDPLAAWAQVREDAVDVGHRWRPAESPRAAAARLAAARGISGEPREALQRIVGQVERARYARPSDDAGDAAALRSDAGAVRRGLLAGADRRTRWSARLAPMSTLRWMAHAGGSLVADLLDRSDELVAAAGARARRVMSRRPRSA